MSKLNMIRAALCAGAMAVALPSAAVAQRPVVVGGGGLVNVQIVDVIDDINVNVEDINVTVGVAVQIAANICGVAVGVISADLQDGTATCDNLVDGTGQVVTINR
jgi:hypothetical protein